jgi:hypothetical protein
MRRRLWIAAFLTALVACSRTLAAEPDGCPPQGNCLQRLQPVGGWHPYGGGVLHWWNPDCFPRCGAPDDYCRKPLPRVCWPAYPSYYSWGTPEICYPQSNGPRECNQPH